MPRLVGTATERAHLSIILVLGAERWRIGGLVKAAGGQGAATRCWWLDLAIDCCGRHDRAYESQNMLCQWVRRHYMGGTSVFEGARSNCTCSVTMSNVWSSPATVMAVMVNRGPLPALGKHSQVIIRGTGHAMHPSNQFPCHGAMCRGALHCSTNGGAAHSGMHLLRNNVWGYAGIVAHRSCNGCWACLVTPMPLPLLLLADLLPLIVQLLCQHVSHLLLQCRLGLQHRQRLLFGHLHECAVGEGEGWGEGW